MNVSISDLVSGKLFSYNGVGDGPAWDSLLSFVFFDMTKVVEKGTCKVISSPPEGGFGLDAVLRITCSTIVTWPASRGNRRPQ